MTPTFTSSAVQPARCLPKGRVEHDSAVERLLASYRAIPEGSTVRLAKRTSNLFRPRTSSPGAGIVTGLDVTGLDGVISIDRHPDGSATADVQGMCSYESLVAATLTEGFMPLVVPQLKTITLGGAVTGLGIESTSFRNGLPHESVLELDVLTGAGELLTVTPEGEHAELFAAFPNSYGTLGYSVRLRIALEPVHPYVSLRNVRFDSLDALAATIGRIAETGEYEHQRVDFLDGVVFSENESIVILGSWRDEPTQPVSDYTAALVYYRSLRSREHDALTVHDYLWRWDTDWFWCSAAFGAQHAVVRRLWPARLRRSDVYHRIVGWENRYRVAARIERWRGRPARERVVQDVEVPITRTADFLRWFLAHVPMAPLWICPLRVRPRAAPWSLYPLRPGETYVNVGFWGTVPIEAGRADGDVNRAIEAAVADFDGHKSLYSDAYYDEDRFWSIYGGRAYQAVKHRYDPQHRLLDLYAKAVRAR